MNRALSIRFFAHSWVSDWNHGNAHFLRGLVRELVRMGHEVRCYEEISGWSLSNLVHEGEVAYRAIDDFHRIYPELNVRFFQRDKSLPTLLNRELAGADLVIIHEWNEPQVVNEILARKGRFGFRALFHDTHHRAYTNAGQILRFHLHLFDGVLAFGDAIRKIYSDGFGIARVWTFHEAADVSVFRPMQRSKEIDLVWIGNWGDEERTEELIEFLVAPAFDLIADQRRVRVHGVRYPEGAKDTLRRAGIEFCGYVANLEAPEVYARSRLALHVPRRQYANGLSGVPTIRVFEALACGVPLVCSPWVDTEQLFRPDRDYVVAHNRAEMSALLDELLKDKTARQQIASSGLETIRKHHTCRHRAEQLMEIFGEFTR
ncbi:MAG: glycosyltransferase [Acidobacteria bacterium]|nr:MAG: glycosyltransferase [Acidobacteriota bacterium]